MQQSGDYNVCHERYENEHFQDYFFYLFVGDSIECFIDHSNACQAEITTLRTMAWTTNFLMATATHVLAVTKSNVLMGRRTNFPTVTTSNVTMVISTQVLNVTATNVTVVVTMNVSTVMALNVTTLITSNVLFYTITSIVVLIMKIMTSTILIPNRTRT